MDSRFDAAHRPGMTNTDIGVAWAKAHVRRAHRMFSPTGLDHPSQLESPEEIRVYAHVIPGQPERAEPGIHSHKPALFKTVVDERP